MISNSKNTIADIAQGLGLPFLVLAMLAMMMIPLPPLALDVLFTFNIALSLGILLTTVYVKRPLDFGCPVALWGRPAMPRQASVGINSACLVDRRPVFATGRWPSSSSLRAA